MSEPVVMTSASREPLPPRERDELYEANLAVEALEGAVARARAAYHAAEKAVHNYGRKLTEARARVAQLLEKRL